MEYKELMDMFAHDVGMSEPVAYTGDGNQCCLEINGRDIGFRYMTEVRRLVLWTEIGELPPDDREAIFARLLRENYMKTDLPDGFLSLSDADVVCAQCAIPMPVCDKDEFYLLLLRFMTVADEWGQMVEDAASGDASDAEFRQEAAPSAISPDSPFLRV